MGFLLTPGNVLDGVLCNSLDDCLLAAFISPFSLLQLHLFLISSDNESINPFQKTPGILPGAGPLSQFQYSSLDKLSTSFFFFFLSIRRVEQNK